MNELTAAHGEELERLRQAYERGEISQIAANERLAQTIDQELAKPDQEIDNAYLNACAELIAEINREEMARIPDGEEASWKAIQTQIRSKRRRVACRAPQWVIRAVGMAACLALFLLTSVSYSWKWLEPVQSEDGQEYYLRGREVKILEGTEAKAYNSSLEMRECLTQNFNELCEFLGYTPAMPTWVPEGWEVTEYYGNQRDYRYDYEVVYEKPGVKYIMRYSFSYTTMPEYVSITLFQDGVGDYRRLANGKEVYLYTNAGSRGAIWHTDCTIEFVDGPISEEELIKMVESIKKTEGE